MKYFLIWLAIVATCAALTCAFIYAIDSEFSDEVIYSKVPK